MTDAPVDSAERFDLIITAEDEHQRLDVYLAELDTHALTRSQVRRCLDAGQVLVNGAQVKPGYNLRLGDHVCWTLEPARPMRAAPQDIPLSILYEDAHVAIIDKPAGMVVHPALGHPDGTLVNAILFHFQQLAQTSDAIRPGIVHRIDRDTSGAIAVTRTDAMHLHLAKKFAAHDLQRTYHALVVDQGLPDRGTFDTLHGRDPTHRMRFTGRVDRGKRAVTRFEVVRRFASQAALVACTLETGRTHQIRMHFSEASCPLLGDQLYGGRKASASPRIARQALHAVSLGFEHLDGTPVLAHAPYPADFQAALDALDRGLNWRP